MGVIPFPKAPTRIRCVRYATIRDQLAGLSSDLIAAATETPDPIANGELVSAAQRLRHILRRMESAI